MHIRIFLTFLAIWLTFSTSQTAIAQSCTLTNAQQAVVNQYKSMSEQYIQSGNQIQEAYCYNKIAYTYWEANCNTEAINYFTKSADINEKIKNPNAVKVINNNLGMIYSDIEQYDKALVAFEKSLAIEKQYFNNKASLASGVLNIASVYAYKKEYAKSNEYALDALARSQEINDLHMIRSSYSMLYENNKALGNSDKAAEYSELFSTFNAYIKEQEMILLREESLTKIHQAELAKKEKELELVQQSLELGATRDSLDRVELENKQRQLQIDNMEKERRLKEIEAQQQQQEAQLKFQRMIIFAFIIGFIIMAILSILIFMQYKAKKRAFEAVKLLNNELAFKNNQLEVAQRSLETANTDLEQKNRQITDSIKYAQKIQEAILPTALAIEENFSDSFVFYKPKDLVSGDFYWFSQQEEKLFIAAVDCTGHSVPGAFMSMIGNTLLNEIVNEKQIHSTSEILQKLNDGIIYALKQETEDANSQDGMAISICCIDNSKRKLYISCAEHTVFIISQDQIKTIDGDIFSIGGNSIALDLEVQFTEHEFDITEDMYVYLYSDGFQDQYGGPENKKFMGGKLSDLLFENHKKTGQKQREKLIHAFENWKGDEHQTDDVLVIGIKVEA